jgi:GNAT superfamily N-acetyltransferase
VIAVRRVGPDEVAPLHEIVRACGADLAARLGLHHWDPPLPLEELREHARTREVYAVLDGSRLVGTFTVGLEAIPRYPREIFSAVEPALYLNRLAVLPSMQGRGLGRACMAEVESLARDRGARAVRFDAVAAYTGLRAFYRRLGYAERGPFRLGELPVECFEKLLQGAE